MIKQLRLMLLAANISLRPWLFLAIQLFLLLIASTISFIPSSGSSNFINGVIGVGMLSVYFGSFTTGISCICTALSAESLRLPFANIAVMLRTMFFTLGLCIAPYVLLLVIRHYQPYWFISISLLLHSTTVLILMTPATVSAPLYLIVFSQVARIGQILYLREQDTYSIVIALALSAILYSLAWMRFKTISKRSASTIRNMSFVELRNYGQTDQTQTGNNIYSAFFSSNDSSRKIRLPKGNAVKAMRMIMLPQSNTNRWVSSGVSLIVAAVLFTVLAPSIDAELTRPVVSLFAVMFVMLLIPALPMVELIRLFKKSSNDLNELALLPKLTLNKSLLYTLVLAVGKPLVLAGVLTFVLSFAALFTTSISIAATLVVALLAAVIAMALQILQYLFMFRHGTISGSSTNIFNTLTATIFAAQIALGISAMIIIYRVKNSGLSDANLSVPATTFALIALILLILGLRWYRHLKSLPHPFVSFC